MRAAEAATSLSWCLQVQGVVVHKSVFLGLLEPARDRLAVSREQKVVVVVDKRGRGGY